MKRRQYARLLSAREVAEGFGKTPKTVRTYVHKGKLRAIQHPDMPVDMRFRPCDVEAFLGVPLEKMR